MRRCLPFIILILAFAALPAVAQAPRAPKPYSPVAITRPAAFDDASFATFRLALAAVAKRRLYAELTPLVLAQGFFWDRDFGRGFDPHKPAVDNLAAAISLESGNGAGWETLASFTAEDAAEPLPSRPGVICAPARPDYDSVAFSKLLEATYTAGIDWAYPRRDATVVRAASQPDAPKLGTLDAHFVRLLGFSGADSEANPGRNLWAHIALPDGTPGFVPPGSLMSLTSERLCYIKDLVGVWHIAGYIAGGN
jgi:hypothetical protein